MRCINNPFLYLVLIKTRPMKKYFQFPLLLLFVFNAIAVEAQDYDHKIELSPLVGYALNGTLNFVQGDIKFHDSMNFGAALSVNAGYGTFAELIYTFSATDANYRSYYNLDSRKFDLDIHYIQIGGVKEFKVDRIRPFGTLGLGASGFVPKNEPTLESWWSFAINLGVGAKINITEHIGIRLQARMLMPLYFNGVGFFCGSGGCSSGVTTSSMVIQGDFMGGLIFGF